MILTNMLRIYALPRAFFISTTLILVGSAQEHVCQCPPSGFLHFYFLALASLCLTCSTVSMPFLRLSSFLRCFIMENVGYLKLGFNALQRAFFISTKVYQSLQKCKKNCFNALQRAFFISTLPFGIPCKYWLSRLVFAGYFQNILKTSIFELILVLFTICSYLYLFLILL